jgi:hypothetical protein
MLDGSQCVSPVEGAIPSTIRISWILTFRVSGSKGKPVILPEMRHPGNRSLPAATSPIGWYVIADVGVMSVPSGNSSTDWIAAVVVGRGVGTVVAGFW